MSFAVNAENLEIGAVRDWLESAPPTANLTLSGAQLRDLLSMTAPGPQPCADFGAETWRERIWTVPPETRIGVPELAEALGRSSNWVHAHTSSRRAGEGRIPHRKLDGRLSFLVGEVLAWLEETEIVEVPPPPRTQALPLRRASLPRPRIHSR